jgi:hypothetical protein
MGCREVVIAAAFETKEQSRNSKDGILAFDDPLVAVFEDAAGPVLEEETTREVVVAGVVMNVVCGASVPTVMVFFPSTIHSRLVLDAHGLGAGGVVKAPCCSLEIEVEIVDLVTTVENSWGEVEVGAEIGDSQTVLPLNTAQFAKSVWPEQVWGPTNGFGGVGLVIVANPRESKEQRRSSKNGIFALDDPLVCPF